MLQPRWTYSNSGRLTKWYGHVDYYGQYVIGQWFALDAETGTEHWAGKFFRPTTVCDCAYDMIIASETRSDGPWIAGFGIYGIDARSGELRWTNHGSGIWGKILRCFDFVPGFTNEFRDVPRCVVGQYVVTGHNRVLDITTGSECPNVDVKQPAKLQRSAPAQQLYDNKRLQVDGGTIVVDPTGDDFIVRLRDHDLTDVWKFSAAEHNVFGAGNYYSYRLVGNRIFMIVGDAPRTVPIKQDNPLYHKLNPANYSLGILDIESGQYNEQPLADAAGLTECRIEAVRNSRLLVSADNTRLAEYEIAT